MKQQEQLISKFKKFTSKVSIIHIVALLFGLTYFNTPEYKIQWWILVVFESIRLVTPVIDLIVSSVINAYEEFKKTNNKWKT